MKRILLLMLCMFFVAVPAMAKDKPAELLREDFGARGLLLGEPATEEQMTKAFGKPLFDNDVSVYGIHVRYYQFDKNIKVGVLKADDTVCDIVIKDQDYIGRDGVRYGATPHKIKHTYGPYERTNIDGITWYMFYNPQDEKQKLMLETVAGVYTLESWRITSLPVTLEEAERYDDAWQDGDHGIDTSAVEDREVNSQDRWKKGVLKK